MVQETEKKAEQGQNHLNVPVAIFAKDGLIFVVREKIPQKYVRNEWRLLTGRQDRGEERAEDLLGLAKECGFKIVVKGEIGSWYGGDNNENIKFLAGRPVVFNFYQCEVAEGDFNPQMLYPHNEDSHFNQLTDYEGKWFKLEELAGEAELHSLVAEALRLLTKK